MCVCLASLCKHHWARILVQVTLYRRLRIGRDGHSDITTNPKKIYQVFGQPSKHETLAQRLFIVGPPFTTNSKPANIWRMCHVCWEMILHLKISCALPFNPLTAGVAYIRVFIFYLHIKYHLFNMLKNKI